MSILETITFIKKIIWVMQLDTFFVVRQEKGTISSSSAGGDGSADGAGVGAVEGAGANC